MRLSKKIMTMLTAGAFALGMLGLLGCSGESASDASTEEESQAEVIEVTGSGATEIWEVELDNAGDDIEVPVSHYAFTVVNHDEEGRVAQNVLFNVTGFDDTGAMVFQDGCTAGYVYPGMTTALSGDTISYSPEGTHTTITQVVVEPIMNEVQWLDTDMKNSQIADLFTVVNDGSNKVDDVLTFAGTITGNLADKDKIFDTTSLDEDVLEAHAVVILYDENDNIVMGTESTSVLIDQDFLDKVKAFEESGESWTDPDANAPINLLASVSNAPDYRRYQLYVMPGLE